MSGSKRWAFILSAPTALQHCMPLHQPSTHRFAFTHTYTILPSVEEDPYNFLFAHHSTSTLVRSTVARVANGNISIRIYDIRGRCERGKPHKYVQKLLPPIRFYSMRTTWIKCADVNMTFVCSTHRFILLNSYYIWSTSETLMRSKAQTEKKTRVSKYNIFNGDSYRSRCVSLCLHFFLFVFTVQRLS